MSLSADPQEVREFVSYMRLRNLTPRTIVEYQRVLTQFLRRCPPDLERLQDVTFEHLRAYIAGLQQQGLAPKTVWDRVVILKRFFGFLMVEGYLTKDPAEWLPFPKVGSRLPKALTLEETAALLVAAPAQALPGVARRGNAGYRDRVLLELMYSGGLRVGEVVQLRVENIDWEEGALRVVGKGDRERRVYLKPMVLQTLQDYIRAFDVSDVLFPGYRGCPLTVRNVQDRIKRYAEAAGVTKRVTPHSLRHSIAVHYLQGGAPLNVLQSLLGHSHLGTTGRYLQLTDQMAKQIALTTETGLERLMRAQGEGSSAEEKREEYPAGAGLEWYDLYVAVVGEWLGR